eukprot:GFUD01017925.1.p1 GENE.GFUD01017925.1~~GFUD01017925.1.p1  ORF type:complete len:335 (-),score=111.39 GFUD01017925.1:101-1105(-)
MGSTEKFCLRWNDFESNISGAFRELREDKDFFDVTLACDDDQLQAHKVILSACSPFFRTILRRNKHEHPLLYLKGVKYADLVSVLNFMYQGEVNVAQEELNSFLAVAEDLKVKGLTQTNSDYKKPANPQHSGSAKPSDKTDPLPTPKRQRPAPPPAPRAAPPSYHPDEDDIQEVVPVKSEPVPLPPDTQTHSLTHMAQVEQAYSTPQVDQMATGVVADPNMEYGEEYGDYEGYEGADGTYEGGVLDASGMDMGGQDGNKELDDLILSNMMKTKNEFGKPEWQCNVCGKKGAHKRSLMVHVESHMDLVEQQCPYCEKRPKTRDALRVHIKDYHKK